MSGDTHTLERQLTVLLRRANRIHLSTQDGEEALERSAYAIMCQLADEGPQRLGSIAAAFGLDPSTVTGQVRRLERTGLAVREKDPTDRRASILSLTNAGRRVLGRTRSHRRERLDKALGDWSDRDLADLARLLSHLNVSLDRLDGQLLIAVAAVLELAV